MSKSFTRTVPSHLFTFTHILKRSFHTHTHTNDLKISSNPKYIIIYVYNIYKCIYLLYFYLTALSSRAALLTFSSVDRDVVTRNRSDILYSTLVVSRKWPKRFFSVDETIQLKIYDSYLAWIPNSSPAVQAAVIDLVRGLFYGRKFCEFFQVMVLLIYSKKK